MISSFLVALPAKWWSQKVKQISLMISIRRNWSGSSRPVEFHCKFLSFDFRTGSIKFGHSLATLKKPIESFNLKLFKSSMSCGPTLNLAGLLNPSRRKGHPRKKEEEQFETNLIIYFHKYIFFFVHSSQRESIIYKVKIIYKRGSVVICMRSCLPTHEEPVCHLMARHNFRQISV